MRVGGRTDGTWWLQIITHRRDNVHGASSSDCSQRTMWMDGLHVIECMYVQRLQQKAVRQQSINHFGSFDDNEKTKNSTSVAVHASDRTQDYLFGNET